MIQTHNTQLAMSGAAQTAPVSARVAVGAGNRFGYVPVLAVRCIR